MFKKKHLPSDLEYVSTIKFKSTDLYFLWLLSKCLGTKCRLHLGSLCLLHGNEDYATEAFEKEEATSLRGLHQVKSGCCLPVSCIIISLAQARAEGLGIFVDGRSGGNPSNQDCHQDRCSTRQCYKLRRQTAWFKPQVPCLTSYVRGSILELNLLEFQFSHLQNGANFAPTIEGSCED